MGVICDGLEDSDVISSSIEMADFIPGERVRLADDDWDIVGHELILLDPEPVPGSSQCLIADNGEPITVSRARLRRA